MFGRIPGRPDDDPAPRLPIPEEYRRIDVRRRLPGEQLLPLLLEMRPHNLHPEAMDFPVGHLNRFVGHQIRRDKLFARVGVDQAPSGKQGTESVALSVHRHDAPKSLRLLRDDSKQPLLTLRRFHHAGNLNEHKKQLVTKSKRQMLGDVLMQVRTQPRDTALRDMVDV